MFTEVKGQRSLVFEGLVQHLYSQFFVDCGATHSFVSLDFARANHLPFEPVEQTSATLADGNGVSIHGVLKSLDVKLVHFALNRISLWLTFRSTMMCSGWTS